MITQLKSQENVQKKRKEKTNLLAETIFGL